MKEIKKVQSATYCCINRKTVDIKKLIKSVK